MIDPKLLAELGDVPPERIVTKPPPGEATWKHLLRNVDRDKLFTELVDGVLVLKPTSVQAGVLSVQFIGHLGNWSDANGNLGVRTGISGPFRLGPKVIRLPNVAFVYWDRFPGRRIPEAIADLAPDLAIETLAGQTPAEIRRKLRDYFDAGTRLMWVVDPPERSVTVYTSPDQGRLLHLTDTLEGGEVLPGFKLPLAELYEHFS
jgi:Uma2 family endonuclease